SATVCHRLPPHGFGPPCPACFPTSTSASRARSAGASASSAAASAATWSACSGLPSAVQTGVQTDEESSASPLLGSLASDAPLLDTLGVTGSSPVAPIR